MTYNYHVFSILCIIVIAFVNVSLIGRKCVAFESLHRTGSCENTSSLKARTCSDLSMVLILIN